MTEQPRDGGRQSQRNPPAETISLRDHLDRVVGDLEKHIDTKFDSIRREIATVAATSAAATVAAKEAVLKAEAAVERRLSDLNELRQVVTETLNTMLPRAEAKQRFDAIDNNVSRLEKTVEARVQRGAGLMSGWGYLVAGIAAIVAVATLIILIVN